MFADLGLVWQHFLPLCRLPLPLEMEMPLFLGRVALVLQHLPPLLQESGVVHNRGVWTIKNGKEVKINEQKSKQGERNVSFHIKRVVLHLKIHLNIPYYCRLFKVPLHTYEAGKHFPSSAIAWQCCFPVMQISMVLPWQVVGEWKVERIALHSFLPLLSESDSIAVHQWVAWKCKEKMNETRTESKWWVKFSPWTEHSRHQPCSAVRNQQCTWHQVQQQKKTT